jgi:Xaa-Pro aminopeptidase
VHNHKLLAFLLATILSSLSEPALRSEDRAESAAVVQVQPDRARKCGLGAAFHAGRRAALLAKLEEGVVLVRGLPPPREYVPYRQDKTFWYLTGIESPDAALVLDVRSKKQILFLPKANRNFEMWNGERWDTGDPWVKDVTGFEDVRPADELLAVMKELTASTKVAWISMEPYGALSFASDQATAYDRQIEKDPFDGRTSREKALKAKLEGQLGVEVRDLQKFLDEMRRVKTPEEIEALRGASRAGAAAMVEAIASTRPGLGEWDIESLMTFIHRREGADGPAYEAIVGSGRNSLSLHYSACTRTMQSGDILLVDYAPEFDHYTSDITRSWPVDGKFTAKMAEIYDVVLEAQKAGIAAVKPGATFTAMESACRKVLKAHDMSKLMTHSAGHYVGMEVHDVGSSMKPFEPGVVVTVEPGVYDTESGIGIRIEDVVIVTADGCEVLSAGVPKERKAIEELVASEGLLDRQKPASAGGARESRPGSDPKR